MSISDDFGAWKKQKKQNDIPVQQEIPDQGSLDDRGFFSRAYADVKDTVSRWGIGAVQGGKEVLKQGEALNNIDPLAFSQETIPNIEKTAEQQQQADLYNKASNTFLEETVKPIVMPAALVSKVAGVAALPFMASDIKHSYNAAANPSVGMGDLRNEEVNPGTAPKGGVIEGAKKVAWDFTFGGISDWANQPDFNKQMHDKPISTLGNGFMAIAAPLLLSKGAYEGMSRIREAKKVGVNTDGSPIIKPINTEGKTMEETLASIRDNQSVAFAEAGKDITPPVVKEVTAPKVEGNSIIAEGETQLGKPYQLGSDGTNATDCGLFTQQTLAKNGVKLDYRTADGQYRQLETEGKVFTNQADAQVGDLVFFDVPSNRDTWKPSNDPNAVNGNGEAYKGVTHVGIYAGEGKVLQAGSHGVSYADINAFGDIVGFGKVAEGGSSELLKNNNSAKFNDLQPHEHDFLQQSYDNGWDINSLAKDMNNTYDEIIKNHVKYLKDSMENGRVEKRSMTPNEVADSGYIFNPTISSNPTWYKEFYKYNGKKPNNTDLKNIAIEHLKNGFYDELHGEIPADSNFNKVEDALNGINQIRQKVAGTLGENSNIGSSSTNYRDVSIQEIERKLSRKSTEKTGLKPNEQGSLGRYSTVPAETTYDKPVTRAEIIKEINDLVPARTGRLGNSEYEGLYKTDAGVIRSRNYGDFNTYAHEIGHYVDSKLKITGHDAELIRAADNEWTGSKEYESYTPEQRRAEGVAEFSRQYLINPAEAIKNFPGYGKEFVSKLATDTKLSKSIDGIGNKIRAWYAQTPEARARGGVSFADEKTNTIMDKARELGRSAYEKFIDDKDVLSRLTTSIEKIIGKKLEFEKNPYKKARMVQNSALARAEMMITDDNPSLVTATLNKLYNGRLKYDVTMKSILQQLDSKVLNEKYPNYLKDGNFGDSWNKAFSTLLVAKRQVELQKINPDYQGPMSKEVAKITIDNAPQELKDLTKQYYEYNDNLLNIAVDSGLISEELYKTLSDKYKEYAPMMRDFSDEEALTSAFSTKKGLGNIGNQLKKLSEEGSTRSVIDPLENTMINTYKMISAAERNKVAQLFVDLSKEKDIGKFVEKVAGDTGDVKKSIFTVLVDGEKQAYQTTPEFYNAIMSLNQQPASVLIKLFKPFAKALRIGATISPDFIVRNLIRDTLTAGIYSETGFVPVLDTIKGMSAMKLKPELAYEFKASGAPLAALTGLDRNNIGEILNKMAKGDQWNKYNPIEYVKYGYEGLRQLSESAESSTRIREFERARQQGLSIEESGLLAKDVTLDFSRSGTITRQINQVIPFFNAVVQGGDRFIRALKDNPQRTTIKAVMSITFPSIALWLINHDKQWYQEMNDDIKNGSWLFEVNGSIVRVPKPFEPGIFFGSSIERALDQAYLDNPKAMKQWAKYMAEGFLPGLMPTLAGPIVEWITNYNIFTAKQIVGKREQSLPDGYQFNAYTSELAKVLGRNLNVSPMKIDNAIAGYTASAGKFAVGMLDPVLGGDNKLPAKTTAELPGIKGLTYTPLKNPKSVQEFYDKVDEVEKQYAVSGKKGNPPSEVVRFRQYNEQVSKLNKANRDLLNGNKSPEEKRSLIDANNAKILTIAKKALGKN